MCMCVICIFVIRAVDVDGAHGADNEPSYTNTDNVTKQTPNNTIDADGPDGVSTQPDKKPKKVKKKLPKRRNQRNPKCKNQVRVHYHFDPALTHNRITFESPRSILISVVICV